MLTPPTKPHALCSLALACATACLGLNAQAQSQTYTAKLLAHPSTSSDCFDTQAALSDSGDVSTTCSYAAVNLITIIAALGSQSPSTASNFRAVVWRGGGSPQVLNGSATQSQSSTLGILPNGDVIGAIYSRNSTTASSTGPQVWRGSTRSSYTLPAGFNTGWVVNQVSRGGNTLLLLAFDALTKQPRFATVTDGAAKQLPNPPAICSNWGGSGPIMQWAVNDSGQLALVTQVTAPYPGLPSSSMYVPSACLWTGATWQVAPAFPNYQDAQGFESREYELRVTGLSNDGQLLMRQDKFAYAWLGDSRFETVDNRIHRLGVNNERLGGDHPYGHDLSRHATVWKDGKAIDLSTVASAPAGYALGSALATNRKGQILVMAESTKPGASSSMSRLVVLTPN